LYFLFKNEKQPVNAEHVTEVDDYVPGYMLIAVVLLLILASFFEFPVIDEYKNGMICLVLFIITLVRSLIKDKNLDMFKVVCKEFDYQTILILCGLFIVIAAITEAGVIDAISNWFSTLGNGNVFVLYTILVFGSVILSAFIDNIPYVAAMLPVVQGIAIKLGISPEVLYFGLLTGATLGGNITPFGASANVTGIGILKKEGYDVKNSDFFKIGIPFTFTAVIIGYLFIWFVWK